MLRGASGFRTACLSFLRSKQGVELNRSDEVFTSRDAVMKLSEIRDVLRCEVLTGEDDLSMEVQTVVASDGMSEILAFAHPGALMITGLTNVQSVRTADIANVRAIVYIRGKRPNDRTINLARESGIPVLASHVGGLPEAKLGIDYVLPVQPIREYEDRFDSQGLRIPVIPPQNVGPWETALGRLLSDREHYGQLSGLSRRAALRFVSRLSVADFEKYLEELPLPSRADQRSSAGEPRGEHPAWAAFGARLSDLTPDRRALVMLRLGRKHHDTQPVSSESVGEKEAGPSPREKARGATPEAGNACGASSTEANGATHPCRGAKPEALLAHAPSESEPRADEVPVAEEARRLTADEADAPDGIH